MKPFLFVTWHKPTPEHPQLPGSSAAVAAAALMFYSWRAVTVALTAPWSRRSDRDKTGIAGCLISRLILIRFSKKGLNGSDRCRPPDFTLHHSPVNFPACYLSHSSCLSLRLCVARSPSRSCVSLSFRKSCFGLLRWVPGPRRCYCAAGCQHATERNVYSQLFYVFSSFCHNIPPMLKGLYYFSVTSSALSCLSLLQAALWRRSSSKALFIQHLDSAQMLFWKFMTILTDGGWGGWGGS